MNLSVQNRQTCNQPSFNGSYSKLCKRWYDIPREGHLGYEDYYFVSQLKKFLPYGQEELSETRTEEMKKFVNSIKEKVVLTVSGDARYREMCGYGDVVMHNTPIVLTNSDARDYKYLTEQTGTSPQTALNHLLEDVFQFKDTSEVVKHDNLESIESLIISPKKSCTEVGASAYKFVPGKNGKLTARQLLWWPEAPSAEAMDKLEQYVEGPYKRENSPIRRLLARFSKTSSK